MLEWVNYLAAMVIGIALLAPACGGGGAARAIDAQPRDSSVVDTARVPDSSLPACSASAGATAAFFPCGSQADCAPGLVCVGNSSQSGSFYCKPSCGSQADCASWRMQYPTVACVVNQCAGGTGGVGVCNDHPENTLATCCTGEAPQASPWASGGGNFPGGSGAVLLTASGFTLTFLSNDPSLAGQTADNLIRAFFSSIVPESARFNASCPHSVSMTIDPTYSGVAATTGAAIDVSASYVDANTQDYDIITHEDMHVVQAYAFGQANVPSYFVEGLADYARYRYGINNTAAGWTLPDYTTSQHYTDSYRVTARFLVWLENHVNSAIPNDLDATLRAGTYADGWWVTETGQTIDALWASYGQNPAL
jgi:hypothetical protein